jgi:hypothetical protein
VLTVATDDRRPETVSDDILAQLAGAPAGGRRPPYPESAP